MMMMMVIRSVDSLFVSLQIVMNVLRIPMFATLDSVLTQWEVTAAYAPMDIRPPWTNPCV